MAHRFTQIASRACKNSSSRGLTRIIATETIGSNSVQLSTKKVPGSNIFSSLSNNFRTYASAADPSIQQQAQSQPNMSGPIEKSMKEKLEKEFQPELLMIRNDSSKHSHHAAMVAQGGGSGETHFFIEIVSNVFEGKSQISRHRSINTLLSKEFEQKNGLHALSLRTKTPQEYQREQKMFNNIREGKNASDE